jgi:hypothetical protein
MYNSSVQNDLSRVGLPVPLSSGGTVMSPLEPKFGTFIRLHVQNSFTSFSSDSKLTGGLIHTQGFYMLIKIL